MKLTLAHTVLPASSNYPWIYVGQNYLRMRSWEKRLPGKRISISTLIKEEAELQRPHTLEWIRRQREANEDSLHWWMTNLAGRANLVSQFFNSIIQIAALKRWVIENSQELSDVFVLCEDGFLLRAVRDNLKDNVSIRLKAGWWFGCFLDWLYYFLRAVYLLIQQIGWFWCHARMANKTRHHRPVPPKGTVYLVHQCLDDKSFLNDGDLECRYFTTLPTLLEKQGRQVFKLPWLSNVNISLDQVYERLRASSCMIPEDWLKFRDYVRAFFESCKSIFSIRYDVKFEKLDICTLVRRERCHQWGAGFVNARFWRYGPALKRWGQSLSSLVMIDNYESQPCEHVQKFLWRTRMHKTSRFIGYVNALFSRDHMSFHTPTGEVESKIFPDIIITTGPLAQKMLIQQGLPPNRVRTGPALRQSFPSPDCADEKTKGKGLLLMLSFRPGAVELLDKISRVAPWIHSQLGVPVIVKPHPMTTRASILKWMDWEKLPEGWSWHDGEIHQALSKAWCAVSLSTSAVVDGVFSGCIPCMLTCAQDVSFNTLDILADQFPILNNIEDEEIQTRLEEIFVSRRDFYMSETLKIRENLALALNPINDETIAAFD